MKLSFAERLFINSPFRALSLRLLEPLIYESLAPFPSHAQVLDLGCGNGTGLIAISHRQHPANITGIDIDENQLARARKKLKRANVSATLLHADAAQISLPAHTFDVIVSSGCLHHVPNWKAALTQCTRLLQHGGIFYMFETYSPFLKLIQPIAPHPTTNRFTHEELLAELPRHGFTVLGQRNIFGWLGFIAARRTGNANVYD